MSTTTMTEKKKKKIIAEATSKPRNVSTTAKKYKLSIVTVAAWVRRDCKATRAVKTDFTGTMAETPTESKTTVKEDAKFITLDRKTFENIIQENMKFKCLFADMMFDDMVRKKTNTVGQS